MSEASLQDRLRDHAKAFDTLMSLIPAKMYYGEDTTDQWKKKKQTKEEAAAARRAKLDPNSELNRNVKEIMDERAKNKRKLREMEQEEDGGEDEWEDYIPIEGIEAEKPGEGLKKKAAEANKKQKLNETETEPVQPTEPPSKLSRREEKKAARKEKRKEKKTEKKTQNTNESREDGAEQIPTPDATPRPQKQTSKKQAKSPAPKPSDIQEDAAEPEKADAEMADASGLEKTDNVDSVQSSDSDPQSPTFDTHESSTTANDASAEPASTTTSVSSTIPPSEKPKHIKIPADTSALRARLAAKIEALRAARKADGPDGKPVRTRQELIEMRRQKEAKRKAHKKELRMQAKLEEQRKREEALASNSPSIMSPAVELDDGATNFAFGRVAFGDGSQMSHDLSYVLNQGKKKGPSDPKTALLKVQNQKKRLQELDEEKRKDIAEKEAWLTARRRVEGEKIRDDEAMLKKAVKRKEATKRKSEKAWKERADGVKHAQKERQKKREENIRKRREDKILGKAGKKKKGGAGKKKGGRPGFEGSLGVGGRKK